MWRMGATGPARALVLLGALALPAGCGGAGEQQTSEPTASASGAQSGEPVADEMDAECCCQRYDEDGNPTGANVSNQTACKSTGGTCTQDESQCENE
jgi:hypothetical protein